MKLTTVKDIEKAVENLTQNDLQKFRSWFFEYDQDKWDKQLDSDIASGKLDALAKEALAEFENGKTKVI